MQRHQSLDSFNHEIKMKKERIEMILEMGSDGVWMKISPVGSYVGEN